MTTENKCILGARPLSNTKDCLVSFNKEIFSGNGSDMASKIVMVFDQNLKIIINPGPPN